MVSLHKFYQDARLLAKQQRLRVGQAMFNHLYMVRPDLAEKIRATDKDPYYVKSLPDTRWTKFIQFIESNWYDK